MREATVSKGTADAYRIRSAIGNFAAVYVEHGQRGDDPSSQWVRITSTGDFGNYGTFWGSVGGNYVDFLKRIDFDYVMKNLKNYKHMEFDFDASVQNVKREICEMRKRNEIDAEEARKAFDISIGVETCGEERFIGDLLESRLSFFDECWQWVAVKRPNSDCVGFWEEIWPLFLKKLSEVADTQPVIAA
jgi:hypothetical protein